MQQPPIFHGQNLQNKFMTTQRIFTKHLTIAFALIALLSACSSGQYRPIERKKTRTDKIAFRQIPPEPTYNRLGWSATEEMPSKEYARDDSQRPVVSPIIQFEAKQKTLDEIALMLGAASRYRTFVASSISKRRVSLQMLGTLDEISEALERQSGAKIVVDHVLREIRVLGSGYIAPQLSSDSGSDDLPAPAFQSNSPGKDTTPVLPHLAEVR
jgi:hypothetical protein